MVPSPFVRAMRKRDNRTGHRKGYYHPKIANEDRPFIAWDGEGPRDAGYALFGNSRGDAICRPFLGTEDCLALLLETEAANPTAIHVAYGFNYDASMILHDLPWKNLNALKHYNKTYWKGYDLEYVPHKWFKVSKDGVSAKVYDIVSFFGCSFVKACEAWDIGTSEERAQMAADKARRGEFVWADIDSIRDYWLGELDCMVKLADKLRASFLAAGFNIHSWHGPGAVAHSAMTRHKVPDAMKESPVDVRIAARYGFAGGRFEMFRAGHIQQRIYNADLRSAYPSFARNLPNLSRGQWRRTRDYEPGKFAIYRIRYKSRLDPFYPYPLFRRLRGGEVIWPNEVEGWYWSPEASTVANSPEAQIVEGLIFDEEDETDRPFAWIEEYYHRRQMLKRNGQAAEYTYKLIINSVYGQLAQRTGWDRKRRLPPRSHQLEWAGYITSACRAEVGKVAASLGDKLLSIDTDGITSLAPFAITDIGDNLGQWELTEYDEGVFWQSGIYALKTGDHWRKAKTRGIPKGTYSAEEMIECMRQGKPLELAKNTFVGFGLALNGQRSEVNTWRSEPHVFMFGGQGKRFHSDLACSRGTTCGSEIHGLVPRPVRSGPYDSVSSFPHYLPWLGNDPDKEAMLRVIEEYTMFDANHLDDDEGWVKRYAD